MPPFAAADDVRGAAIAHKFYLEVLRNGEPLHAREEFDEPVELGRQEQIKGETPEPLFTKLRRGDVLRYVIARGREDSYVHRHQLRIESSGPGAVRVTNVGHQNGVRVVDHVLLLPQQSGEYRLPVVLQLKELTIRVVSEPAETYESLAYQSMAPGALRKRMSLNVRTSFVPTEQLNVGTLGPWMEAILEVLQSATGREQFYEQAARALVDLAGLERGAVLLKSEGAWKTVACHPPLPADETDSWAPSKSMLAHMERALTAISEANNAPQDVQGSMIGVRQVLAAPILSRDGVVKGALYGDRRGESRGAGVNSANDLLAVKLLASGVANGLARLEIEAEAQTARTLLESFFTKDLADELARNSKLLEGKDTDVSLLFCDVRGFSTITERLGAQATMAWMNDVLTVLSDCVLAEQGVLIDYIGDELFAMFGAPKPQADHARRACRAALAMQRSLTQIDARWQRVIGRRTEVSIGISSGTSRVGNTGSQRRFKYGALGPDVNLASRVQGASKYLKTDLIATERTMQLVGDEFPSRRLCRVKVINIDDPVGVHQIFVNPPENWRELKTRYEEALQLFETGEFMAASRKLGHLFNFFAEDGPSLQLLSRAVTCLVDPQADRNPVWRLPGK